MKLESLLKIKTKEFWQNVLKNDITINEITGCIETTKNYKSVTVNWIEYSLHRISFCLANPEIDITKLLVCHSCDNGKCINDLHLFAGTSSDNMQDMVAKKRNTYIRSTRKFSDDEVRVIRKRCREGSVSQRDLAKELKINRETLKDMLYRRTYKDVLDTNLPAEGGVRD